MVVQEHRRFIRATTNFLIELTLNINMCRCADSKYSDKYLIYCTILQTSKIVIHHYVNISRDTYL